MEPWLLHWVRRGGQDCGSVPTLPAHCWPPLPLGPLSCAPWSLLIRVGLGTGNACPAGHLRGTNAYAPQICQVAAYRAARQQVPSHLCPPVSLRDLLGAPPGLQSLGQSPAALAWQFFDMRNCSAGGNAVLTLFSPRTVTTFSICELWLCFFHAACSSCYL